MKIAQIKDMLRSNEFFSDIPDDVLDQLATKAKSYKIPKDDFLIRDKSPPTEIYLITQGRFAVCKKVPTENTDMKVTLVELPEGEVVGVFSFLDNKPRSADVIAVTDDCEVIEISTQQLTETVPRSFYIKLAKKLSGNIRESNEVIVKNLTHELQQNKKLLNIGRFITYLLLLISFYNLALKGFSALSQNPYTSMFASTTVIFIFTVVLSIMARTMHYPLTKYGINFQNLHRSLLESFIYSLLFIIAITVFKWILIKFVPGFHDVRLIDYQKMLVDSGRNNLLFSVAVVVYSIFIVLQEFIARGILLGSLLDFLFGKHKNVVANVVSSGVFAAMHVHLSAIFALFVFIPSLFWGWLFIRHRTLLSPVLSHWMIGTWAIFVLGIQDLWT